jgi:nitroreductase
MHTIIEQLNWRYATKQYDQQKKIGAADLSVLKESVRLAPSAFGLQPYKVFVVETDTVREKLREKSWGQPQVTDASHLFVFAAQDTVEAAHIDDFIRLVADTRGVSVDDLQGFSNSMKGATGNMTAEAQQLWSARQAYIGLGMLLTTAATLNIDASPMEGFDPAGYKEILGLTDHTPVVIAAVGYRSAEDPMQHLVKVRKPVEQLFQTV